MAWELANEPRGTGHVDAFNEWISRTSGLIKSLDRRHLVTTGCEGDTPSPEASGVDFTRNHAPPASITRRSNIWARIGNWYDPARSTETYAPALEKMRSTCARTRSARAPLGKPIVIEEFGLRGIPPRTIPRPAPRSGTTTMPRSSRRPTVWPARAPVAGVNFWAWAGEGRRGWRALRGRRETLGSGILRTKCRMVQRLRRRTFARLPVISSWALAFSLIGEKSPTRPESRARVSPRGRLAQNPAQAAVASGTVDGDVGARMEKAGRVK